jgi:hypothetical protein
MSISRLDCSLDLVIQSIRTANTVTRSIAVFNSILVKAGDPMSSFLESQNSAVRGAKMQDGYSELGCEIPEKSPVESPVSRGVFRRRILESPSDQS